MITAKIPTIIPVSTKSPFVLGLRLGTSRPYTVESGLFGFAGFPGSCIGLKLISVLHPFNSIKAAERQLSRLHWSSCRSGIAAILALTLQIAAADARASRTVVLLDFSRSVAAVGPVAIESNSAPNEDLSEIAFTMASQFTGAPLYSATEGNLSSMRRRVPTTAAAALLNPFVPYALPLQPQFTLMSVGGADHCIMPPYRASFAFGRAAEERRRILFPLVHRAACEAGLPIGLFDAMIMQESRYQPAVVSPKGAFGLAQLMPGTALQLGVDRYSLVQNLRGGARYLRQHVDRFGRYDLALAAYNAGPMRVERRWQVPAIAETQDYVRTIMGNWTGAPIMIAPPTARPISFRRAQLVFAPAQVRAF
jgi:soluble lytic murein transglycosylase-like protein